MVLARRYKSGTYYYRAVRTAAGPRNIYMRSGPEAEAMAEAERALKVAVAGLKALESAELDRWREFDDEIRKCYEAIDDWHETLMVAVGWYRHQRTWRPRKVSTATLDNPAIQEAFRELPSKVTIRADVVLTTVQKLSLRIAGGNAAVAAELFVWFIRLRDQLAGPSASPIERLMAEDVSLAWLVAREADWAAERYACEIESRVTEFFDKRRTQAHRRFTTACVAFARVRACAMPRIDESVLAQKIAEVLRDREVRPNAEIAQAEVQAPTANQSE